MYLVGEVSVGDVSGRGSVRTPVLVTITSKLLKTRAQNLMKARKDQFS